MTVSKATERLQKALSDLITALSCDDLSAIEIATKRLQRTFEGELNRLINQADSAGLQRLQSMIEAVQCLIWVKLLSLSGKFTSEVMIQEMV